MKGTPKVIDTLNALLADEYAAIHQYTLHAAMCENWGYHALKELADERAMGEMEHVEALLDRILFLEGQPNVVALGPVKIGADVPLQLTADQDAEKRAIANYNAAIGTVTQEGDRDTALNVLAPILADEAEHLNDIEAELSQIAASGLAVYLASKVRAND